MKLLKKTCHLPAHSLVPQYFACGPSFERAYPSLLLLSLLTSAGRCISSEEGNVID
jgi:hypothetical protein